ncbi:AraC family transcriptional regulator [Variovorax sp. J31P216]|nr:AraC family transcriptional regulator [Variovorax sp. J31P216]
MEPSTGAKDTLGCAFSRLQRDQELSAGGVRIYRKTTEGARLGYVETPATGRGVLVGISLRDGHERRILHEHHAASHAFNRGAIYIRDFCDRYRADMKSSFDFVVLEFSPAAIERAIEDREGPRVSGLARVTGGKDEVLANLAMALTPALDRPAEASLLFVDQISVAMGTYLLEKYGGAPRTDMRRRRLLSRSQEARAKEMLRSRIDGSIAIADIAADCNLSRSYFTHAFRETTGQTPLQWLIAQRLARARVLLMDFERPIAEIAAACGFADQSHFTRVFARSMGTPPGTWRREARIDS